MNPKTYCCNYLIAKEIASNIRELKVYPEDANACTDFEGFDKLEILDLKGCKLEAVPKGMFDLPKLRKLNLRGNRGLPPEGISGLKSLQELNLSFCGIKELPAEVGELSELEELRLTECELKALPESLIGLKKLSRLHLDGNSIEDKAIGILSRLPNLKKLVVGGKLSPKCIEVIAGLDSLEILILSTPKYDDLSPLGRLIRLRHFELQGDLTTEDFQWIGKLVNLEFLNVSEVEGAFEEWKALSGLKKLKTLKSWFTERLHEAIPHLSSLSQLSRLSEVRMDNKVRWRNYAQFKGQTYKYLSYDYITEEDVRDLIDTQPEMTEIGFDCAAACTPDLLKFPKLKTIWIERGAPKFDYEWLIGHPTIETVVITTKPSREALEIVLKMPKLKKLCLYAFNPEQARNLLELIPPNLLDVAFKFGNEHADELYEHISKLKHVRELFIGHEGIETKHLQILAGMNWLKELRIKNFGYGSLGLDYGDLETFRQLDFLEVFPCKVEVKRLWEVMPWTRFE